MNINPNPKPNEQYVTLENVKIAIEKEILFWDIVKVILWILWASMLQFYEYWEGSNENFSGTLPVSLGLSFSKGYFFVCYVFLLFS